MADFNAQKVYIPQWLQDARARQQKRRRAQLLRKGGAGRKCRPYTSIHVPPAFADEPLPDALEATIGALARRESAGS